MRKVEVDYNPFADTNYKHFDITPTEDEIRHLEENPTAANADVIVNKYNKPAALKPVEVDYDPFQQESRPAPVSPAPAPRLMMASPQPKEPSGPLGRVLNILSDTAEAAGKGAMSGFTQIGQSVGTGLKYLGGRTGSKSITKLGEETQKGWVDIGKDYEAPEDIEGNVVDKPELLLNPSWLAYNLAQTGVSMLPGMVAGAGVGGAATKGIKILGKMYKWTPKLAKRLMTLGYALPAGVIGGAQEGTSTYEEVIKRGGTEQEAARAMEAMTTASGILNAISFGKIFEKLPQNQKSKVVNYVRKFIETGATEATTEYGEEPAEILIKMGLTKRGMTAEEVKNQLKQGVNVLLPSFLVGGGSRVAASGDVRDDGNQGLPGQGKPPIPKQESETFTDENDISSGENKSEAAAKGQKPAGDIGERPESNGKQTPAEDPGDNGIAETLGELNSDADELLGKEEIAEVKTLKEDISRLESVMEKNAHFKGAPIYETWTNALNNNKARLNDLTIDKTGESDKIIHKEKGGEYERINDAIPEMVSGETEANFGELVADLRGTAQQKGYSPEELSTEPENFLKAVDEAQGIEQNRRVNYSHRKKVSEMTPDERAEALLTDHLTGQKNKRAYQESERLPFQASIDVDGLKYVNDTFGHEAGNVLLKKVGDALNRASEGKNNYHFHGDEFALEGNSNKELNAIVEKAKEILKSEPLEFKGEKYVADFSYGIAETTEGDKPLLDADKAMMANKTERRVERGKKTPEPRTETTEAGEQQEKVGDLFAEQKETMPGTKAIAQRMVNADQSFIDSVIEQFGFSREDAVKILNKYKDLKVVSTDVVGGQFNLKDGRFWDKEVMENAIAETMEAADKAMLENKASRKIERGKNPKDELPAPLSKTNAATVGVKEVKSGQQEKVNLAERRRQKRKEKIKKSLPVAPGAENAAQFLIKAGKVRLGEDFTTKTGTAWERAHGKRSKDQSRELGIIAQVTSKNGKMAMDEAATLLNKEGFVSRTGEPWTDDSLYQEMAYGDLRNILHPNHAERIIERKIQEKENDWIEEQLDRLEREKSLTGNEIHPQEDILSDIATEGNLTEEQYQAARDEISSFFDEIGKTDESVRTESTTAGEQSTLTGMSAAETFSLANPETDWSKSKPIPQQTTPKTAGLFNEEEKQFVESPDGGIDFGQIPKELEEKSDGKYPAAPIRLEKGAAEDYGHSHIGEERIKEIKEVGYKDELDMLSDVSKSYTHIYEQPNGRILLVKKNGKSKYAVVELQKEPDNYYGATTWFLDEKPIRGRPYEERSGMKLLLEVAPTLNTGLSSPFPNAGSKNRPDTSRRLGKSSSPTPENNIAPEDESVKTKGIDDFGEKIGGARKDTAERGYTMSGKTESKNDNQPAWAKRYKIAESVYHPGTWAILDTKSRFGGSKQTFSSEEEAKKAIPVFAVAESHRVYQSRENNDKWSIYKKVGERKLFKVVNQDFPSREEGMKYMSEHAEEILNIKTSFGEEILPVPEIAIRTGIERRQGDATPEMFMESFAPRGIEFGNWNNQEERQQVLNHAYDGLLDLADALNVPPKALMLNGELAIAFGARGQGLVGARAHYERDYGVINLTKMKGAGSLAHEIFHAMDHYFARLDTKAKSEKVKNERGDLVFPASSRGNDYQSHGAGYKSQLRPEVQTAYKNLMETMYNKAEQYVEDTKRADEFVGKARETLRDELGKVRKYLERDLVKEYGEYRKNKKGLHPASAEQLAEFDRLANKLVEGGDLETRHYANENARSKWSIGRYSNDTLEAINAIYKAVRNRSGFNAERGGTLDRVQSYMKIYAARLKMFEEAKAGTEKTKKVPTNYAIEAKKMDQARTSDYWSEPHEMAARAFSSFVEDKIAEQGGQSDFLVYQAHGGILLPMIDGYVARPYPEGAERVAINQAFQKFIEALKIRETERGIAFFLRRDISKKETVDNNIRWWENRDWKKELLALPKEYWHGKTRDFISEGYIPITRSEADNLYKEDLGEFVSWVQVRGDETTGLEGIFIKPFRYKGYEPYYYKEGTHYRNKAAYQTYQEFRDRYRNSLRNIPGKIDMPKGRDSSAIREEADREEIKQTRVADRGEEYGKEHRLPDAGGSPSERGNDIAAIRKEHERQVGAERQILARETRAPAELRKACKEGKGLIHDPGGYDTPEYKYAQKLASKYGLDVIPVKDETKSIHAYIREKSILLDVDFSDVEISAEQAISHELSHWLRNRPLNRRTRKAIDTKSAAFKKYRNLISSKYGVDLIVPEIVEEIAADLEAGITVHYGVNILDAVKKGEKIFTLEEMIKDKKEVNEEPARAPPDDKARFLWKEVDGLTDRQKEVRSRIERNLQKFGEAAQKAGLPLGDYLKKEGMPEAQIKRLLDYAKEQQVEYEGYREVGPDEVLPSEAEIKMDFISGKTFVKIKKTTGIKNAVVNAERKDEGKDPIAKQGRKGNETMLQEAKEAVDSGVLDPRLLADEIISSPRPITTEEEFALMYDRMRIKNELEDIRSKIDSAHTQGDVQAEFDLIVRRTQFENYLDANSAASTHAGTEVARSLQARARMIAEDYSLQEILRKAREDNGGSLSEEMRQKYEALAKEIEEANKKIKAYEERIAALEAKRAFQKIKNDSIIEKHLRQAPTKRGAAKEKLDHDFSILTKQLNSALGGLHFNFDPTAIKILGQMARNRIMAGAITPDSIINEIYDQIHASYPEIEKRDIRDAISGYGRKTQSSKEEIDIQLREAKRQMRLISKLEDVQSGKKPFIKKASSVKSDEVARLENELKTEMKRRGFNVSEEASRKAYKTRMENTIKELEDKLNRGDFTKKPQKKRVLDEEELTLRHDLDRAIYRYKQAAMKDRLARRTILEKAFGAVAETANFVRALKASMDVSAVFRQGLFTVVSHPVIGAKALPDMFKAFKNDKHRFAVEQDILNRPNAHLYKEYELELTDIGADLSAMEETFMSRLAEKIPGVSGSQRAYTTFLNKIRADCFDLLLKNLVQKEGLHTDAEGKAIARLINEATGRGSLGKKANAWTGLNTIFFAPRLVASRFQLLAGHSMWGGTQASRKLIAKEYGRFISGIAMVYILASMAGDDDIEFDPRSPNFAKIRFGNTRIDPLAGLIQVTTFLAKEITGSKKTDRGRVVPLREYFNLGRGRKAYNDDTFLTLARFVRSKFSPAIGISIDAWNGENVVGEKVDGEYWAKAFAPMAWVDTFEAMQEHGIPQGAAMGTLAMLGVGISTYDSRQRK